MFTNALVHETSPYLRSHAHNPVQWHPWGEAALQKARRENKPLLISIGYAACHWCHVMERESFADTAVARVMNDLFVCVKVDREERPDVDARYAAAAELITGNAGWPLNCLALPDGQPFFAGTYYPKDEWTRLLREYASLYGRQPEALRTHAEKVARGLRAGGLPPGTRAEKPNRAALTTAFANWTQAFDTREGGYGRSPKFPLPASLQALLGYYHFTGDSTALRQALLTLDKLASGGIYDHLGGGFARYAVDRSWRVPHFEKMLYDNAQLASVYARAYQLTGNERYKTVVAETLDFVAREMTAPEGGCYGSVDADSEGEEGRFYAWTAAEIGRHLGPEAAAFNEVYHVTKAGNWEAGRNVLYLTARTANQTASLAESRRKLLAARLGRPRPLVDRKVITGWNALMVRGYVDAYRATGEERWLRSAERGAQFGLRRLRTRDGGLYRQFAGGKPSGAAFLEDYAYTIDAFLALYQATFAEKWLHEAHALLGYAATHFGESGAGYFYDALDATASPLGRPVELTDNALPSGNSVMARNLFYLGHYFYRDDYLQRSWRMVAGLLPAVGQNALAHAGWFSLLTHWVQPFYQVAVVGDGFAAARRELDRHYLPNVLLLGGPREGTLELLQAKYVPGRTTFYVCRDRACKKPVTTAGEALAQLE